MSDDQKWQRSKPKTEEELSLEAAIDREKAEINAARAAQKDSELYDTLIENRRQKVDRINKLTLAERKKLIEANAKARENMCLAIQNDIIGLSKKLKKLVDADLELYDTLIGPDAIFDDCPIGASYTYHFIRQYMIKQDFDFIGASFDGKHTIKDLFDQAKETSRWILRFTKEKELPKTGIEAIVEGGRNGRSSNSASAATGR